MDISRLSESAQRQILAKLGQQAKPTKYRNEKATRRMPNGTIRTFDSQREARRYDELVLLLKAGKISDLRLQQTFTLQEGYISASGDAVRALTYKADFYYTKGGKSIVEDVKGVKTEAYKIKKKLMQERGIEIIEV